MNTRILSFFMLMVLLFACKKQEPTFSISGEIAGGENKTIYFERMGLDTTLLLDSLKIGTDKKFSFTSGNGKENPEFYRLRIAGLTIPFIVDSTEQITLNASISDFGNFYNFEGTPHATYLREVELLIEELSQKVVRYEKRAHLGAITYAAMRDSIAKDFATAKSQLSAKIAVMPQSPVSYYILFSRLFGANLFDIDDPFDQKLFGAVATNFDINYPNTARGEHLKNEFLLALKLKKTAQQSSKKLEEIVTNVRAMGNFEINLPNNKGAMVKLSSTRGKVTMLCFTSLQAEYSATLTATLGEIYQANTGNPFEIYQVCFDADENFWRNSAANFPWICVRERLLMESNLIVQYNLQQLPTIYLIDKEGDIVKRFDNLSELSDAVKALL